MSTTPPEPDSHQPAPKPEPPKPAPTPRDPAAHADYLEGELRKWRGRAENSYGLLNQLGVNDSDAVAALKEKAARADALEQESMSERDKAVAEASKTAKAEAESHYRPLLVRARIEAAAAGRIEADRLSTMLDPLDMSKFLTDSGDVDADKVSAYVNGIAPEKSNPPASRGPALPGVSRASDAKPAVSSGQALWEQRHPNRVST